MDTLAYLAGGTYETTLLSMSDNLNVPYGKFAVTWNASRILASTGSFKTTQARINYIAHELRVPISTDLSSRMTNQIESMWIDNVRLYEDAVPLLRELKRKDIRIAIVSNGPVAMDPLCDVLGLTHLIDAFVLSCHIGVTKPNRLIYQEALGSIGVLPRDCIFIGDGNDHELDGAKDLGIFAIKINRAPAPYALPSNRSKDWDLEVNALEDIKRIIQ